MSKYQRKSWRDKFNNPGKGLPKVVRGSGTWDIQFGGRRILVATPKLFDVLIHKIPKCKLATINQLRTKLAKKFKADNACLITSGIFTHIVSDVAEGDALDGKVLKSPPSSVITLDKFLHSH